MEPILSNVSAAATATSPATCSPAFTARSGSRPSPPRCRPATPLRRRAPARSASGRSVAPPDRQRRLSVTAMLSRRVFLQGAGGLVLAGTGTAAYACGVEPGLRLDVTTYQLTPSWLAERPQAALRRRRRHPRLRSLDVARPHPRDRRRHQCAGPRRHGAARRLQRRPQLRDGRRAATAMGRPRCRAQGAARHLRDPRQSRLVARRAALDEGGRRRVGAARAEAGRHRRARERQRRAGERRAARLARRPRRPDGGAHRPQGSPRSRRPRRHAGAGHRRRARDPARPRAPHLPQGAGPRVADAVRPHPRRPGQPAGAERLVEPPRARHHATSTATSSRTAAT